MKIKQSTLLIALAYISFISLGLPDGLLGVALPSVRREFGLSLAAVGAVWVTGVSGYMLSSFNSGRILSRMSVGMLLALSCLSTATALLGYSVAPVWGVIVVLGFLSGLGAGAIDAGLNTYVASHFNARILNWLHAFFGIGAASGPAIMTAVLEADISWRFGYQIVGIGQLVLAACFFLTRDWWRGSPNPDAPEKPPVTPAKMGETLRLPVAWLGILMFFLYTGLEVTAGQWTFTLFTEGRGVDEGVAGVWISIYWWSLTAGRLGFGVIVSYAPVVLLLRLCMIGAGLGAFLMLIDVADIVSFVGLALIGLCIAPIFPSLIANTPERLGEAHTANAVGFQVAAASLGAAIMPTLGGLLADIFSLEVLPAFIMAVAVGLLALFSLSVTLSRARVQESKLASPPSNASL